MLMTLITSRLSATLFVFTLEVGGNGCEGGGHNSKMTATDLPAFLCVESTYSLDCRLHLSLRITLLGSGMRVACIAEVEGCPLSSPFIY